MPAIPAKPVETNTSTASVGVGVNIDTDTDDVGVNIDTLPETEKQTNQPLVNEYFDSVATDNIASL